MTSIVPSIFCTNSSCDTECGYSLLVENVSRDLLGTDWTTKLSYENDGEISTSQFSLNASTHLFGTEFITIRNEISAKKDEPVSASSSATVNDDTDMSYKVFIEMLY